MTRYKVNKTVNPRHAHSLLITPPLAVILMSCFIFVLVQPAPPKKATPSASSHSTPSAAQPKLTLPMAQNTTLPLIEPVAADKNSGGAPGSIATTTPQATSSSVSSLQSANTNNQQSNSSITVNKSVIKSVTNTVKKTTSGKH